MTITAYPVQELLVREMQRVLPAHRWALLKIGQRGGKTVLSAMVAKALNFDKTFVLAPTIDQAKTLLPAYREFNVPVKACGPRVPREIAELESGTDKRYLAVIDSAMWIKDSYDLFDELRNTEATVLVISSRGPEYDSDLRWRILPGYSLATWDINPLTTLDQLLDHVGHDVPRLIRDYCGF